MKKSRIEHGEEGLVEIIFYLGFQKKCRPTNESFYVSYLCRSAGMTKFILRQPATLITCNVPLGDVPNHMEDGGAQFGALY